MCFVNTSDPHNYRCCICFPLACGVFLIALLECLNLYFAVAFMNIYGIVISCLLIAVFCVSLCKSEAQWARDTLFWSYTTSAALFLLGIIIFISTQNLTSFLDTLCDTINEHVTFEDCYNLSDLVWVIILVYTLVMLCIKGSFLYILNNFRKQLSHQTDSYTKVDQESGAYIVDGSNANKML